MNPSKRLETKKLTLAALCIGVCAGCGESSGDPSNENSGDPSNEDSGDPSNENSGDPSNENSGGSSNGSSDRELPPSRIAAELQCKGQDAELEPCTDYKGGSGAPIQEAIPHLCEDLGASFVRRVAAAFNPDSSTATLSRPERGRICLSGALGAASPDTWGADLILGLTERTPYGDAVLSTFDAEVLGIAAVRFTLHPPPNRRMTVIADVVTRCECPGEPYSCAEGGRYRLAAPNGEEPVVITEPETITAPLSDFVAEALNEPLLGTHPLSHFLLHLDPADEPFDYEFCVDGIEFLDAEGDLITPPV